ncbi:MAG TPA: NAD(P)H-dependent glycerol-3-phosphate dehydrogenase [Thermomicrobiales bacterium]|nr:NAD(P)H-dependent glycerol-3-phosphate dehydrogenase [Thermomicrobiales bacterium]
MSGHDIPRVTVIGGGAWGTTLAMLVLRAGSECTLVVRDEAACAVMANKHRHPRSLPGVTLPENLQMTSDAASALANADIVILAIPTQKLRDGVASLAGMLRGRIVVSAAKGIEVETLKRPTEILEEVLSGQGASVCALSGPNLASEVAQGKPATTVIATRDADAGNVVRRCLMSESFRVYTSTDVTGVEIGGALKNIIAIGAGIGDGLDAGDNAKAAFMTRGIAEISRLGTALGANPLTFAGLSGIGDLIATCSSRLSRNHRVGAGLAAGQSLADVLAGMDEVAEGVDTTRAGRDLAARAGVEMPITEQMYRVLFEGKSPVDAVLDLMRREPQGE